MSFNELLNCLGESVQEEKVSKVISLYAGFDPREIQLVQGMYSSNVVLKEKGIEFVFVDESMFLGLGNTIGKGPLYFASCILNSREREGYAVFGESFYRGLFVVDDLPLVQSVLGPSDTRRELAGAALGWERWGNLEKYTIQVSYDVESRKTTSVQLSFPKRRH